MGEDQITFSLARLACAEGARQLLRDERDGVDEFESLRRLANDTLEGAGGHAETIADIAATAIGLLAGAVKKELIAEGKMNDDGDLVMEDGTVKSL